MTGWTALVPLRGSGPRKTRLATVLTPEQRQALSDAMFHHVVGTLAGVTAITRIVVLSDLRPQGWAGALIEDQGRGLNAELTAAAANLSSPLLIIHADLPRLSQTDIATLLDAAISAGCAIAPDRHGTGTNALALSSAAGFAFAFGVDSCKLHQHAAAGRFALVARAGLGLDVDTPEDLRVAQTRVA